MATIEDPPSQLSPLDAKGFGLHTVDIGGITLHHETKNIGVDIQINVSFKGNVFAFSQHLIECNFDLIIV